MERHPKTLTDASELLQLSALLNSSVHTVIGEWAKEASPSVGESTTGILPSPALHQAQRTILAIAGKLTELVSEPCSRVLEVACQYWECRALSVAAERRIPDLLASKGDAGVPVKTLAEVTGVESKKLSRLLRSLCSIHIFKEVAPDVFANNVTSAALVDNEPLRAYVMNFALDLYTASDHLPKSLLGPKGHSYQVDETAWQDAHGTSKTRWDWLEEKLPAEELGKSGPGYPGHPDIATILKGTQAQDLVERPEHKVFSLAMLGGGMVYGAAHPYDFPWHSLGKATVVDVGGGLGGFDIQLSRLYPELSFVVQDRGPGLKHAREVVWPKEAPQALAQGRVTFMEHDFFQPQPVKDADVYWLRYVIHDWSDEYCATILRNIRNSMSSSKSRVLICDQVMNTTFGSPELESAPSPLPANYGYYTRYSHQRDLCMMGIINGIERTPAEFRELVKKAGFRVEKIWECRSQVSIVELRADEGSEVDGLLLPASHVSEVVDVNAAANGSHANGEARANDASAIKSGIRVANGIAVANGVDH